MTNTARGFLVGPLGGSPLPAAGGQLLASAEDTGGSISVIRSNAPDGDYVPLHVHASTDECFYVLLGQYRVGCAEQTFDAYAGSFVFLPRGVPHGYTATADSAMFILGVPAGIERLFADIAAGASDAELAERHGVTFEP